MHVVAPVAAGLVAGTAFIAAFIIWADEPPIYRVASISGQVVTIPQGASMSERNFEPQDVLIETGDFVEWTNEELVALKVVIEPACEPREGYNANVTSTGTEKFLMPGERFDCLFSEANEYNVHTEPWPWMRGAITVSP